MKQMMTKEALMSFYKTDTIREGAECYEYLDKVTNLAFELPREFQVFIDGSLIDPIKFLKMPPHVWNFVFDDDVMPLDAKYLCGHCTMSGERRDEIKFYPGNPMDDVKKMNAVIVEACWDLREDVSDHDWGNQMQAMYDDRIVWFLRKTDVYEISGKWYWMIMVSDFDDFTTFGMAALMMQYVGTLRPMCQLADQKMAKFEKCKANYRGRILDCLNGLPGRVHWIAADGEDRLWPKYDANRELWEKNEYDYQVTLFDNSVEIRSRGGSPGQISVERLRYDPVGLRLCRDFVKSNI